MDRKFNTDLFEFLREIVDFLKTSTIAEEKEQDVRSNFWAAYNKVSGEYDDNMLERCNGYMDILLLFAGLFSAVTTAFIIAMQPNPVDTTNTLLVQLIQITVYGASAAQPTILSPSTNYPSIFWMQALSYMSLALSLLSTFGAVMGKQWLNYYKTGRFGSGSLEQRCNQRHSKFQGVEKWCFEGLLQSLADLLKLSLFLFGLSLAAWMWTQQQTISILIILIITFGFVCYVFTALASMVNRNCPFQTRLSIAFHDFFPDRQVKEDSIASAMEWMVRISTKPDAIRAALELVQQMPSILGNQKDLTVSLCTRVRDMFMACFDIRGIPIVQEDARAYGESLIKFSWDDSRTRCMLRESIQGKNFWTLWHKLRLPSMLEECQRLYNQASRSYVADIRSALLMVVPAGMDEFTSPDDKGSVWDGKFGVERELEEVEWLMACATQFLRAEDFEAVGAALLLLSGVLKTSSVLDQTFITQFLKSSHQSHELRHTALHTAFQILHYNIKNHLPCHPHFLDAFLMAICPPIQNGNNGNDVPFTNAVQLLDVTRSAKLKDRDLACFPLSDVHCLVLLALPKPSLNDPEKYVPYCRALISHMGSDRGNNSESRRIALRRAFNARHDLAMITDVRVDASLRDIVLSKLSPALLTVVPPDKHNTNYDTYYLRLIFVLTSSPDWLPRLASDGHIERCIRIIPEFRDEPPYYLFYLAGIFLRLQAANPESAAPQLSTITSKQWWDLTRMAWHVIGDYNVLDDGIDIFGALVEATKIHMPDDASRGELKWLDKRLGSTGTRLKGQAAEIQYAVSGLKELVRSRL